MGVALPPPSPLFTLPPPAGQAHPRRSCMQGEGKGGGFDGPTLNKRLAEAIMQSTPKGLRILSWATAALFAVAVYLVFFYAPLEAVMGEVQRVFYFHVAAGWVGGGGFA